MSWTHLGDETRPANLTLPPACQVVLIHTQAEADERIPPLLGKGPLVVHAVPRERVDLRRLLWRGEILDPLDTQNNMAAPLIDGLIVEGGDHPVHPDWVRSLRDQAVAAGVPFCFRGWGEWGPSPDAGLPETLPTYGPSHHHYFDDPPHKVWRFGKDRSGRVLDGRTWDQTPEVDHA